jgi:uncharacterized protein YcbK (DUF882 family)
MIYFKEEEFNCPCCGINNMDKELLDILDKARDIAGVSFNITSGYRCSKHNKEVGGSNTSSHLLGLAVDISATNSTSRFKIIKSLLDVGIRRVGIAKTFIHCDIDASKAPEVAWVY